MFFRSGRRSVPVWPGDLRRPPGKEAHALAQQFAGDPEGARSTVPRKSWRMLPPRGRQSRRNFGQDRAGGRRLHFLAVPCDPQRLRSATPSGLQPGRYGVQGFWDEVAVEAPDDQDQQRGPEVLAMGDAKQSRAASETRGPGKFFKDSVAGHPSHRNLSARLGDSSSTTSRRGTFGTKCHAAKPSRRPANHRSLFGGSI